MNFLDWFIENAWHLLAFAGRNFFEGLALFALVILPLLLLKNPKDEGSKLGRFRARVLPFMDEHILKAKALKQFLEERFEKPKSQRWNMTQAQADFFGKSGIALAIVTAGTIGSMMIMIGLILGS